MVPVNNLCLFCELEEENLIHMLSVCPLYNAVRYKYAEVFTDSSNIPEKWLSNLNSSDPSLIKKVVNIVIEMIKIRASELSFKNV